MAYWRSMSNNDIPAVTYVADKIHSNLPESPSVFEERVKLFPEGCLVLATERQEIGGYIILHPIRQRSPPALDTLLGEIPQDADQYYIHDLAILPKFQGRGFAAEGVREILEVSNSYSTTSLVSVYGTSPFWGRFGFEVRPVEARMSAKIRGYGDDAI
ncbi:hypothetical protein B0T21DRAFT_132640 [Apiosordaria backusii]|uniref:N-acetyltransferase domain-containing protein n=1 Tax=Apiosordaria backusii TaxID=314023 RepID=A0AA40K1H5_9PEZI|nr:hypothetical protein B0T21DRAFT_132640 [Apiosordaria backusii]